MLRVEGKAPTVLLVPKGHMGRARRRKVSELSTYTKTEMLLQNLKASFRLADSHWRKEASRKKALPALVDGA